MDEHRNGVKWSLVRKCGERKSRESESLGEREREKEVVVSVFTFETRGQGNEDGGITRKFTKG